MAKLLNKNEKKENQVNSEEKLKKNEINELTDLNEKFLVNAKGKEVIDLVKVFNPQDRIILRSILDSEGIETYVKSNHFGELYPTYDLHNFATSVISIYKEN